MRSRGIKILFVGPYPPPLSGPELGMQMFLQSEFLNRNLNILFLQTNFRKKNKYKGKFGLPMVINFFKYFVRLVHKLSSSDVSAIYYPITPTQIGWIGRDAWTILLAKIFKKKIIIHLRGSHFNLNFQEFSLCAKKLTGFALTKVDCAIVQAYYLRDQFSPFILPSKTKVVYQAIDSGEFQNDNLDNYNRGKILIVGHLTKAKGYIDILRIIPDIVNEFPFVHFYFAGEIRKGERGVFYNQATGEKIKYEDPIEMERLLIRSPYSSHYHHLGVVTGVEKYEHFRSCDFFLSASYSEGFSRSLLEAMAIGKPLVYTPVGAHREVLKDNVNGISFEPGNLFQMKTAIGKMLTLNDLRRRMAYYNYNEARIKYSQDGIDRVFLDIINQVADK